MDPISVIFHREDVPISERWLKVDTDLPHKQRFIGKSDSTQSVYTERRLGCGSGFLELLGFEEAIKDLAHN